MVLCKIVVSQLTTESAHVNTMQNTVKMKVILTSIKKRTVLHNYETENMFFSQCLELLSCVAVLQDAKLMQADIVLTFVMYCIVLYSIQKKVQYHSTYNCICLVHHIPPLFFFLSFFSFFSAIIHTPHQLKSVVYNHNQYLLQFIILQNSLISNCCFVHSFSVFIF